MEWDCDDTGWWCWETAVVDRRDGIYMRRQWLTEGTAHETASWECLPVTVWLPSLTISHFHLHVINCTPLFAARGQFTKTQHKKINTSLFAQICNRFVCKKAIRWSIYEKIEKLKIFEMKIINIWYKTSQLEHSKCLKRFGISAREWTTFTYYLWHFIQFYLHCGWWSSFNHLFTHSTILYAAEESFC